MYGVEWLIGLAVLGVLAGLGGGYLLAGRRDGTRNRELEAQLAASRQELNDYRQEVVKQFSTTARKFQTLNDSYTDLHEQLARSSSVLCGDLTGPLLEAPAGHQDLIPAEVRARADVADDTARAAAQARAGAASSDPAADAAPGPVLDPYEDDSEIRVPEPRPTTQAAVTDTDPASAASAAADSATPTRQATGS